MPISYARHRFPPDVIRRAAWLHIRFTLSYRDVEELLAEHGLDVSYETIRRWILKSGLQYARNLCARRPRPSGQWLLGAQLSPGHRRWAAFPTLSSLPEAVSVFRDDACFGYFNATRRLTG